MTIDNPKNAASKDEVTLSTYPDTPDPSAPVAQVADKAGATAEASRQHPGELTPGAQADKAPEADEGPRHQNH